MSLKLDTGHTSRQYLPVHTDTDEKRQQIKTLEDVKQDVNAQHQDGKHPVEDTPEETTPMQSERLHIFPSTDEVIMPTKKVGCILVTSHLTQFLEDYSSSSEEQAFLDIYHMLSLIDKYLYVHLKQHTHCLSSDDEYVTLL